MIFPFKIENGKIVDCRGRECVLYPDVPAILSWLQSNQIQVGLASRVTNIAGAFLLLNLFKIRDYFWPVEVYPTSKVLHFEQMERRMISVNQISQYLRTARVLPYREKTRRVERFRERTRIRKKTGLDYCDMMFFDDDKRNLRDLLRLELPCVHVPKGLKFDEFLEAIANANWQFKDG